MKKLVLLIHFLFAGSFAFAQVLWQKCLGGTNDDYGYSIKQTNDNGFIIAAGTHSIDGDVTGNHSGIHSDMWVIKLSLAGDITWQKCYGGSDYDEASSIQQTTDGGYIVAGVSRSSDGDVTANHGSDDYWIVKITASGSIEWQRSLGGSNIDYTSCVIQALDGGYILSGTTWSNDGDVSGSHGNSDCWIVKLSSSGIVLWQKCLGGSNYEDCAKVVQLTDGSLIIAGSAGSIDGDVSGNHSVDRADGWLVKLSSSGVLQWQQCIGGKGYDSFTDLVQSPDGGFVAVGHTDNSDGDGGGNYDDVDCWVVKLSSVGVVEWHKAYGGVAGSGKAQSITATTDGGYIISCVNVPTADGVDVYGYTDLYHHGSSDAWLVKISGSGDLQWQHCFGGNGIDASNGSSIIQASDGNYMMATTAGYYSAGDSRDVKGNHGLTDVWVVKIGTATAALNGVGSRPSLTVIPNPAADVIYIGGLNSGSVSIYDMAGRLLKNEAIKDHCSVASLHSGIYVLKIYDTQHQLVYQDKLIKN